MGSDWDEPLQALRWHWGSAYIINCARLGRWTAERRDNHETLRDGTPLGLRDKIIADYSAHPVPRGNQKPREPEGTNVSRWTTGTGGRILRLDDVPAGEW